MNEQAYLEYICTCVGMHISIHCMYTRLLSDLLGECFYVGLGAFQCPPADVHAHGLNAHIVCRQITLTF